MKHYRLLEDALEFHTNAPSASEPSDLFSRSNHTRAGKYV